MAGNIDPMLTGTKAFKHPAVNRYWRWLLEEYRPRYSVALVTPCSRVKPYTKSPTSRKIRGLLRRLGLWNVGSPRGIVWLYFSDLLILVPYEKAEEYPACCYDVPPSMVLTNGLLRTRVVKLLAEAVSRLVWRGLAELIVFLPKAHKRLWDEAKRYAGMWPGEVVVRYTIFSLDGLRRILAPYSMQKTLEVV